MIASDHKAIYRMIGASNHVPEERQKEDYYATEPIAAEHLLKLEEFSKNIWEPACGEGHLSNVLSNSHEVLSTDLIDRGYGTGGVDFFQQTEIFNGDIITNPPFSLAQKFVEHALTLVNEGSKVAMFLKVQFLETKARKEFFNTTPLKTVYISSSRIMCAKNGDFEGLKKSGGSAIAYAWYVWEKGYKGEAKLKWF